MEKKIINYTNRLIQNLKDELSFFDKIISNFNGEFINNTYYKDIKYINEYIQDINNTDLIEFSKSCDFSVQTKMMVTWCIFRKKNN